jgi:hypothetical protein
MNATMYELARMSVVDVDNVLSGKQYCKLGKSTECEGMAGTFKSESNLMAILGSKWANSQTRMLFFGENGKVVSVESTEGWNVGERPQEIGHDQIGGDGVSGKHVKIEKTGSMFYVQDLESTNGTTLIKPTRFEQGKDDYDTKLVEVALEEQMGSVFVSFGEASIVRILKLKEGEFFVTDAVDSRKNYARLLTIVTETDGLTIGSKAINPGDERFTGQKLGLLDNDLGSADLRMFVNNGKLYIVNLADKPMGIVSEMQPKSEEAEVKPPRAEQPKEKKVASKQKKLNTARIWKDLDREIKKEAASEKDPKKLFRKFAMKYAPDKNPDDVNAHRRMQLILRHFLGSGE